MNKYYIPKLEEFCMGFEYEMEEYGLPSYKKYILDIKTSLEFLEDHSDEIRVKYLNQSDIEFFGFEEEYAPDCYTEEDEIKLGYVLKLSSTDDIVLHLHTNNILSIVKQSVYDEHSGNWTACLLFKGKVKNKSELKQILQMLSVIK